MAEPRLTLAFDLAALRRLADPGAVVDDAGRWSEHVGVVTDRPQHVLTKFTRDHGIEQDFSPDPDPASTTLEHLLEHFETARYVHVGAAGPHERRVDGTSWEYRPVEEAAESAGWTLADDGARGGTGRVDTTTDDWP